MTSDVIPYSIKKLRLDKVSNYRFFFIKIDLKTDMLQRKKLKSRSPVLTEFRRILVRYRRTYVLNKTHNLHKDLYVCACISLFGLCWAKKTGIFKLGTLTIMNIAICLSNPLSL